MLVTISSFISHQFIGVSTTPLCVLPIVTVHMLSCLQGEKPVCIYDPLSRIAVQEVGPLSRIAVQEVGPLSRIAVQEVGPLSRIAVQEAGPLPQCMEHGASSCSYASEL